MRVGIWCLLGFTFISQVWGSAFSGNKVEDLFVVKAILENQASVEGEIGSLKVGDFLYFVRAPYKFSITSISGKKITVAIPKEHSLRVGQNLLRQANDQIKKSLDTEGRIDKALDE